MSTQNVETVNTVENVNGVINNLNVSEMKQQDLRTEAGYDLGQEIISEVYNPENEKKMRQESGKFEVGIDLGGECRMAAFARGINRGVSEKNVQMLAERIKAKGFRRAEVVQVIPAEKALEMDPKLVLVDQYGCTIKQEEAGQYHLIVDGQHRVLALQVVNDELTEEQQITAPAVEVELAEGETISQYIYDINSTKEEWSTADYAQSAQLVQQNPLLERYAALMKSRSNPEGLTLTVLNRMYCGSPKAISGGDFKALCEGRTTKGRKQRSVIPVYNLERGNTILSVCESAGITCRDLNRKFVMDLFDELELKYSREVANETFANLCKGDVEEWRNKRGVMDEELFCSYMRELAESVNGLGKEVA